MTSFFQFVNKQTIYLDGKISLAHVWCQMIKSQNKNIYMFVNVFNICTEINHHIQKLINMRSAIKTYKLNTIVTAFSSIRLSGRKSTC